MPCICRTDSSHIHTSKHFEYTAIKKPIRWKNYAFAFVNVCVSMQRFGVLLRMCSCAVDLPVKSSTKFRHFHFVVDAVWNRYTSEKRIFNSTSFLALCVFLTAYRSDSSKSVKKGKPTLCFSVVFTFLSNVNFFYSYRQTLWTDCQKKKESKEKRRSETAFAATTASTGIECLCNDCVNIPPIELCKTGIDAFTSFLLKKKIFNFRPRRSTYL